MWSASHTLDFNWIQLKVLVGLLQNISLVFKILACCVLLGRCPDRKYIFEQNLDIWRTERSSASTEMHDGKDSITRVLDQRQRFPFKTHIAQL